MIVLDIWDVPHVTRILSKWITGQSSKIGSFVVLLVRILLRYAYGVKVEGVLVTLCKPQDGFISS